jgi:hypothetical protein
MGIFKIFRKNNTENQTNISKDDSLDTNSVPINGAYGIDAIYAFLQFDYESRGYNDALTSPEESYKADNLKLFKHDFFILIDKSTTYYEGLLKQVDFHIGSRTRAGLIDLVEELKFRRELVLDHLEKIKIIKEEATKEDGATRRITLSYQRGFMRGLSAITQSKVFNRNL